MPEPIIKLADREIPLRDKVTTCGRASDNTISVPGDSNVSRYHAEIERRGDDYYLIDLGTVNGTTVNGEKLNGEKPLKEGDRIVLGGSSEMEFTSAAPEGEAGASTDNSAFGSAPDVGGGLSYAVGDLAGQAGGSSAASMPQSVVSADAIAATNSGSGPVILIAGAICGIALVCAVAAAAFYLTRGSSACTAKAVITKPEAGETINTPTAIEVDAEDTGCVSKAVFTIDGEEFATADSAPFTATIDPKQFPDYSDGLDHSVEIALFDAEGNPIGDPSGISLALETREIKPSATRSPVIAQTGSTPVPANTPTGGGVSLLDLQQMSTQLVQQFSGQHKYNVSNKQFLQEVQKRTAEYSQDGYYQRASAYKDKINVAYVREQNLDAPLGFVLAMSRSKFNPVKQGDYEGLWQMSNSFVTANAYNGLCGTETLSDQSQDCAAKASALYLRSLVYSVFDGDPIYSAAAFGKSTQEATAWKASLPADKTDIWNVVRTPQEREQLVRFFAAGIVAENPQRFGLKNDRPLSELYRFAM